MGNSNINIKDLDIPYNLGDINMPILYIFGIDATSKKAMIIAFDSSTKTFSEKKVP